MTRVDPRTAWSISCTNIQPMWPEWTEPVQPDLPTNSKNFAIVERGPSSYTLCEAARILGRTCSRADPRHTRIARHVALRGLSEFFSGHIHFLGGLAKDVQEAWQFHSTFIGLQCLQGLLIAPPTYRHSPPRFRAFQTSRNN